MTLYDHPQQHNLIDENGKLSAAWQTFMTNTRNEINFGEPPAKVQEITANIGIKVTSQRTNITIRVISASSSDVNVSIDPQVSAGFDGQLITIIGEDDTRTVTLNDGNGLKLASNITFKEHTSLVLEYNDNKKLWIEKSRALT